jgi:crossover junction endodeoxyribonuclease RuvC
VVLGIDPGTRRTGFGVVVRRGSRLAHVDNGLVAPKADLPLATRLKAIHEALAEAIARYRPDVVAIENVFVHRNVRAALKLGHARGVAMLCAAQAGLDVHEYSPAEVKMSVVGTGRAEKDQVAQMVRLLLALPEVAQTDASDALAVAICHAQRQRDVRFKAARGIDPARTGSIPPEVKP